MQKYIFNTIYVVFLISLTIFSTQTHAAGSSDWSELSTDQMQIIKNTEVRSKTTPLIVQWFFKILSWNPNGLSHNTSCETLAQKWTDFKNLQLYFEACEDKIIDHSILSHFIAARTLSIENDFSKNSLVKPVRFLLNSGVQVSGMLALKDLSKKRPLIILRLGIFGQADDMQAETFIYKMLFEQSHYNFLILDNSSNLHFLNNNPEQLSFAGYDEGLQNLEIAKLLKDTTQPIARLVSSLHLVGVSLGGHGVMYANIKNQENLAPIDSFMAFCPLIQFNETLEYHRTQKSALNYFANFWGELRLGPFIKNKKTEFATSGPILPNLTDYIAQVYAKQNNENENENIFFARNNFIKSSDLSSEILIFASLYDKLVPYDLNAGWMKAKSEEGLFTKAIVQPLKYSFHCSVPDHYFWSTWTDLLNSYVKSKSPGLNFVKERVKKLIPGLSSTEVYQVRKWIKWNRKIKKFEVFIQFFSDSRPYDLKMNLSPSDLDFSFDATVATEEDVKMATRWLYKNINFNIEKVKSEDKFLGVIELYKVL